MLINIHCRKLPGCRLILPRRPPRIWALISAQTRGGLLYFLYQTNTHKICTTRLAFTVRVEWRIFYGVAPTRTHNPHGFALPVQGTMCKKAPVGRATRCAGRREHEVVRESSGGGPETYLRSAFPRSACKVVVDTVVKWHWSNNTPTIVSDTLPKKAIPALNDSMRRCAAQEKQNRCSGKADFSGSDLT